MPPIPSPAVEDDTVLVPSRLFGPMSVCARNILHFADGLRGFASQHRFVLLPATAEGVFWLQSADEGNLVFLVIDPFVFFPDYELPLPTDGSGVFSPEEFDELIVLAIVTLPPTAHAQPTVNLRAPLVVHVDQQRGYQVTDADVGHSHQQLLELPLPA